MAISLLNSQSQLLAQLPQQWLLLLLVIVLPVISYLLLTRRGVEKEMKMPPGPPRLPVLGNLHQLGLLPHQSLRDLSRRHGPVMFLRLGMTPAVAVSSSAAARDVLRAHDADCCNRPALPGNKQLSYGFRTVAFSPYGAYWRDMRRFFADELLGARRVRAAWAARQEQVRRLMAVLGDAASAGPATVAMDEHVYGVADGIIGTMAFGSVYGAATFAGRYDQFRHVLDEAMDVTAGISAEDFFPNAAGRLADRLTGVVTRRERIFRDLDAFFEAVIEQRMEPRPEDDDNGGCLVDALVGLWKQGEQGITKDNVKAILLDSFLGGIDSSSVTILWAMSELVRKPEVMRKAQEEIRAAVAAVHGDNDNGELLPVQPEDIPKLRYLKMVVKETLRLHPPATLLLARETAGHVEIGGYDVPAGTRVLVNAWAIGRDPASWGEDAEEFVPERFEEGEVDFRGAHFELLPFGAGRRICPGLAMGVATVEFTLANMLCGFDWALPEGVEEVSMEEDGGLIVHRKTPLVLVPTTRRRSCSCPPCTAPHAGNNDADA